MKHKKIKNNTDNQPTIKRKDDPRRYVVSGIIFFGMTLLFFCVRIFSAIFNASGATFSDDEILNSILVDIMFAVLIQVVCIGVPSTIVLYFACYRKKPKKFKNDAGLVRTPIVYILLAIAIGVLAYIFNISFSTVWSMGLEGLGYRRAIGLPATTFYPQLLITELVLSAVFPAIFEELAFRSCMLTGLRNRFGAWKSILLSSLAFSLYHINIVQTGYTFVFGIVVGYLTVKLGTVIPAMVVHFVNNFISIYYSYATSFNLFGAGIGEWINNMLASFPFVIAILFVVCMGLLLFLIYFTTRIKPRKRPKLTEYYIWYTPTMPDRKSVV